MILNPEKSRVDSIIKTEELSLEMISIIVAFMLRSQWSLELVVPITEVNYPFTYCSQLECALASPVAHRCLLPMVSAASGYNCSIPKRWLLGTQPAVGSLPAGWNSRKTLKNCAFAYIRVARLYQYQLARRVCPVGLRDLHETASPTIATMSSREPRGYPPKEPPASRSRRPPDDARNDAGAGTRDGTTPRAQLFLDEKRRIISSCFSKLDSDGACTFYLSLYCRWIPLIAAFVREFWVQGYSLAQVADCARNVPLLHNQQVLSSNISPLY
jgi:hypothetical protein